MKLWVAGVALCALACSSSSTARHEELASELRQLHSLDAEGRLLQELVVAHRVPTTFARVHARYLARAIEEHRKKLK